MYAACERVAHTRNRHVRFPGDVPIVSSGAAGVRIDNARSAIRAVPSSGSVRLVLPRCDGAVRGADLARAMGGRRPTSVGSTTVGST